MSDRPGLSERVLQGDVQALARLLTYLENGNPVGDAAMAKLFSHTGNAHTIGVTGPPGGGKSTLINELIRHWRAQDRRVAVIAIDPSSPISGGATLGDRIRMQEWHADPGVFVRSMASRRFGGGLAQHALAISHAFDAAGYDPIVIETVGTGQDEVAIASLAHTTMLVQVPGTGDGVQTLKAGSLEVGDILVVTKGDRPEAAELARDLRNLQGLATAVGHDMSGWVPPVIRTSALLHKGIDTLSAELVRHREWLASSGEWSRRTRSALATEISGRVHQALLAELTEQIASDATSTLIDAVMERRIAPGDAASRILHWRKGSDS